MIAGKNMEHDMPGMGPQCKMNMVFTWDYQNMCVVFPFWRITSRTSFVWSFVAVILLGFFYEGLRSTAARLSQSYRAPPSNGSTDERSLLLRQRKGRKWLMSALYAFQVFYSFFLMLVFMTYNGYFMLAVVVGAFLGHLYFQKGPYGDAERSMSCH